MIKPVSDLRLQKFGNIAEAARRFLAELSTDLFFLESRDRSHDARSRATARIIAKQKTQTERPDWLAGDAA
jgi:tRNA nucleotidyltransferase (CCA-adding enzyme)